MTGRALPAARGRRPDPPAAPVRVPVLPGITQQRLLAAHVEAVRFYRAELARSAAARAYLAGRDLLAVAGQQRWAVGYAPAQWTGLLDHLRDHGYRDQEVDAAGLATWNRAGRLGDRFRGRVMFPLRDATGAVVGFTGRDILNAESTPKYLNSPETPLYRKSTVLFGLAEQQAELVDPRTRRLVVEGPMDVLAVAQALGGDRRPAVAAVATCGTALTAGHIGLLAAGGGSIRPLALAFDPDPAGQAAADRAHQLHWPAAVAVVTLPADPADLLRAHGAAALRAAVTAAGVPLLDAVIEYRLDRFTAGLAAGWAETRIAALRSVGPLVATDLQPSEFTSRVAWLASRLNLDPVDVGAAVLDLVAVDPRPVAGSPKRRNSRA